MLISECKKAADLRGIELLKFASISEMRIVNGLKLEGSNLYADGTVTRAFTASEADDDDPAGTVLHYVFSSEAPLHVFTRPHVADDALIH